MSTQDSHTNMPDVCMLCNTSNNILPAKFFQSYTQIDEVPIINYWWNCKSCGGLFIFPVPTVEQIQRHWGTTSYNNPSGAELIYKNRQGKVVARILNILQSRIQSGKLLDFGTNYGYFLSDVMNAGWDAHGFEPNESAARVARDRGYDVRSGWKCQEAGFAENSFDAITCLDVFYYTWHPYQTLRWFYDVLSPGGVLLMRISNKRAIFELIQNLTFSKKVRDRRMSNLLQSQYHSISAKSLSDIVSAIGFADVELIPNAFSTSWEQLSIFGKFSYVVSYFLYLVTFRRINLSPGVFLIASKKL